jgi:hypothetical protein
MGPADPTSILPDETETTTTTTTTPAGDKVDADDEYAPTTVLIMLGSMHFEHAGSADVISLKISSPEELSETLQNGSKMVKPETLEAVHVVLKSSSISSLFDDTVLSTFYEGLIAETGEVMIHVLPESSVTAEDMPVQAGDVDTIRMSLVMSGLRLEMEQSQDGSWILVARKPGPTEEDDDDDNEQENEREEEEEEEAKVVT